MAEEKQENVNLKKKGGKELIYAGVVIIVLLAVVVFLLLRNGNNDAASESSVALRDVVVNQDNAEDIAASAMAQVPIRSGYYRTIMNSTWNFADGKSASSNAYVENAENNQNDVYFDVRRSDTDELIYSSPIIPIGGYLDEITLDTELSAGTYECVVTYHLVDEAQNTVSELNLFVTIVVEQ